MATSERQARAEHADEGARWIERLAEVTFLRAAFAYAGELRLHFGNPVAYENPKMAGRTRGEWVLSLRATPWVLVADGTLLSRSHDEQQHGLRNFAELEGKRLDDARMRRKDAAVTLHFEDGSWFMALTEPQRRKKATELWELLTPSGLFVVARPDLSIVIEAGDASDTPGATAADDRT